MTEEFIPQYADEVKDFNDPRQALAWGLSEWPGFGEQLPMPTVVALTPYQSELLSGLGYRYHPDLAVIFKVRDPATGRAKFLDEDEYAEYLEEQPDEPAAAPTTVEEMFDRVQTDLERQFDQMTDEQKAAKAAELEPEMKKSMDYLIDLRKRLEAGDDTP